MAINNIRSVLVLVGVLVVGLLVFYAWALQQPHPMSNPQLPTKQITINDSTITAEVADTDQTRQFGLSGRTGLPQGSGMLFVFEQAGNWGFWMKDMNFAIDIIFADDSGTINTIYSDLTPATYEQSMPKIFYPSKPARYVLELPAGYAKAHTIAVGAQLVLQ